MALLQSGRVTDQMWYWLNPDKTVSPAPNASDKVNFRKYSDWLYGIDVNGESNRKIAKTELKGGQIVSTIFMGLDHGHNSKSPVLFETMVFPCEGDFHDIDGERYRTYQQAVAGHVKYVIKHGGEVAKEPPTAQGAREYEEIMKLEQIVKP